MIIDFHTHTFPDSISKKVVEKLGHQVAHINPFTDGSLSGLLSSMKCAGIDYSVTLPVVTSTGQVEKINEGVIRNLDRNLEQGIVSFGGMHPDYANFKKELRHLKEHQIKGIKLHPAYQNVDLNDIRMKRIIDAASELDLIVLIHAGMDIGLYDHNYSSVKHILEVVDEVKPPKFVLAHMGNWDAWDDVEHDLAGAPVWLDTSFSVGKITQYPGDPEKPYMDANLSNEDFVRLCKKHGTDKILFATDSPWAEQKAYVELIGDLAFNKEEMENIFYRNAMRLLKLSF